MELGSTDLPKNHKQKGPMHNRLPIIILSIALFTNGCERRTVERQRTSSQQQVAMRELLIDVAEAMPTEPRTNTVGSFIKAHGGKGLVVPGTTRHFRLNHRTDLWQGMLSNKTSAVALFYLLDNSTNDARGLTFDGQFLDFRLNEGRLSTEDFPE